MPGEDKVMADMRSAGVQPGTYMFPCAESMKDMCTPEMIEKCKRGPVGFLTVVPSAAPGMGKNLLQWFVYCLVGGVIAAYLATLGLQRGAAYMTVFRFVGTAAIVGYAVGGVPDSIWKGQKWSITFKFVIDGVIYGLVTGGTFGWLWPKGV